MTPTDNYYSDVLSATTMAECYTADPSLSSLSFSPEDADTDDSFVLASTPAELLMDHPQEESGGSKISDETLRRYNLAACILHSIQGVAILFASQFVDNIKDFSKEITTSFLVYDEESKSLVTRTKNTGWKVEVGLTAAVFLLMSAFAHFWVLMTFERYLKGLNRGINKARWYEYALSSSVMILAIAVLFGCYDLGTLVLIVFLNASMNLFGLLMEMLNPPDRAGPVDWTPFWCGCWAGAGAWVIVFMYFLGGGNFDQVPGFVYGIFGGYLFFFNTFPVNMALQYAKYGRWSDYRYGELGYIVLSLASKTLLAWLVFGGTNQPDGDDE